MPYFIFLKDDNGFILENELFIVMSKFRGGLTEEDIHAMVRRVDKDNDGKINKKGWIFVFIFDKHKYLTSLIYL